jgi:hypothetical protein
MNGVWIKKTVVPLSLLIISLSVVPFLIPGTGAIVANSSQQVYTLPAHSDLAVTNVSLTNHTVPDEYRVTPTLINVQVSVSETLLPGPKGEMAAGPRTIGLSITPASLVVLVVVLGAVAGGVWYILKRKKDKEPEE